MKTALRALGSVSLLGLLAWRLDWTQIAEAFHRLDVRFWGLALGVFLLAQLISSYRWQMLAVPLGYHLPYRRYVALYFVGMFFNLVLPTSVGGDVVRALYMGGRRPRAFLSVLAERGSGLMVLMLMACVAALFSPVALPGWMLLVLAAIGAGMVGGVLSLPLLPAMTRLPWVGDKVPRLIQLVHTYARLPRLLSGAAALSVLVQLASVAQVWLVCLGLGLEVPFVYLAVAVPLVTLLTLVPISLNGMGLRELGLVVLLGPVGVTAPQAVMLSLLVFATTVAASLLGAVCYLAGPYARIHEPVGVLDHDPAVRRDSDQGREGQPATAA
jgi:uncharacterized membrane protein YbhN (UPF0104 family)